MDNIYVVTVIENFKTRSHRRTVGFYFDEKKAIENVKDNSCDIEECLYDWAVIEEMPAGFYICPTKEMWFKWNEDTKKYEKCEKPEETKGIINWGIG